MAEAASALTFPFIPIFAAGGDSFGLPTLPWWLLLEELDRLAEEPFMYLLNPSPWLSLR